MGHPIVYGLALGGEVLRAPLADTEITHELSGYRNIAGEKRSSAGED